MIIIKSQAQLRLLTLFQLEHKFMYKDGLLTISKWYQGMTKHPIMGFGLVENAEVFENKGLVVPKKGLATTSLIADGLPLAYVIDIYGNFYYATATSIYKNTSSGGVMITGLTLVRDIKIYKDYLWVRYGANIGAYGPLSSAGATWFPALITTFNADYIGQLVVGQDDYLYTTNGNLISKLEVTASGTVGVAPTIVVNTALDLPDGQYTTCITEYGTKIAVGTDKGRIYTWNRQAGTLGNPGLADLPIVFNENAIYQLYSYQNRLYVTAGRNGNVYISDGTNYRKLATIPFTERFEINNQTAYIQPQVTYNPNAIAISSKGNLLVGNVSTNTIAESAVWEIQDSGEVILAYKLVTGKTSASSIGVGFIFINPSDNTVKVGWYKGASDGIDEDTSTFANVTIESPLIRVGSYNKKKSFEHIEFTLADTLAVGDEITISYRKNTSEDYTEIKTWAYTTLGAIASFEDIAGISDCEFIQLKVETQGGVNLIDVNLR